MCDNPSPPPDPIPGTNWELTTGPTTPAEGSPPRGWPAGRALWFGRAFVLVVVAGFLVLGGFEAWRDSATYDEPVYVSSGVVAILHHDVADNAEHPPLFKVLAALPVLTVHPVVPGDGRWNTNHERTYSARFVAAQLRAGTMHKVTVASRLVPLVECALVAWALYALATLLFGAGAGVLAALLWLLDPLVLGIGHLDGVDLPFALASVLASLALVRWLRQRDRRRLWWLGAACGVAVSAQTTGLLVAGLAVGVVLWAGWRAGRRGGPWLGPAAVVLVASWLVVWASYVVIDPGIVTHLWELLPPPYWQGIAYLASHDTGGSPGFLVGQAWTGSNVWFWPVTLLVKLTMPLLVLLLSGTATFVALRRTGRLGRDVWRQTLVAVALPAVVLFVFELPNPKTLGVRYLLPSIALWIVVASPIALVLTRRVLAGAVVLLVALAGVLTVSSYPHSIASTSAPFGPGYRVATDSNLDWGQDLGLLTNWSPSHRPYVAYFGPRGVTVRDIPGARSLLGVPPGRITGWVAASASDLTSADRDTLAWLRGYCPVGTLGGTILLYHFTTAPSDAPGPAAPAGECAGSISHRVGG